MHIDAHQHFWNYTPEEYGWIDETMPALRQNFLPAHIAPELRSNGFSGSIVVQARQTLEETRWLLELADQSPSILGVIGWADLQSAGIQSQLKELSRNRRLVGIRHIVQAETDDRFLLRPAFLHGISALEDFDLVYDILIYTRHLPVAAEFVARFPRQRFVLDHLAKPLIKDGKIEEWAQGIRRVADFPNVFCKLSGLVTEAEWKNWKSEQIYPYLDVAFSAFGPDRLIFGSDWPVCLVAATYARVVHLVKSYLDSVQPQHHDAVLGGNARRVWRL